MNTLKTRLALVLAAALGLAGCTGNAADAQSQLSISRGAGPSTDAMALPGELDTLVDRAAERLPEIIEAGLKTTGVPGAAVAVVYGDEIIFSEGFGVREAGTELPVEPETVFQIASISKSLSATAISAAIAGDDALSWETPIHSLLPDFAFSDPIVSERATIGDAFSHRTGLATGAGDDLEDLGFDQETILARLAQQPLDSFRSTYHYSNFGVTVGAEAVAASRGQSWDDLIDELLFVPLGMENTSARHDDFLAHEDRARLHAKVDGEFVAAYDRDPDAEAPAGGVSSTVLDLAQWMRLLIGSGTLDGKQIADEEALVAAMSPQIVSSHPGTGTERPSLYGHGFNASPHVTGRMAVSHSGAFSLGAATSFQIVPELGLGIVTLTNAAPVGLPEAINASFLDLVMLGEVSRDWVGDFGNAMAGYTEPVGNLVGVDRPAAPAEAPADALLVGQYESQYFGRLTVTRESEGLVARLGANDGTELVLDAWDGANFAYSPVSESAPWGSRSSAEFTLPDPASPAMTLRLDSFDAQGLGTFTRV